MITWCLRVWWWLPLMISATSCAHNSSARCVEAAAKAQPSSATKPPTAPRARPYKLFDGVSGLPLTQETWGEKLKQARLIFVGEQHDNAAHHAFQLDVLKRVHQEDPRVAVALEMLPHTLQAGLDDFVAGRINEKAFLADVDWQRTWGFPYGLYAPLLSFAREHQLRAIAINAPRALTRKLVKSGVEGLSPDEVQALPEMQAGPPAHREFARQAFANHSVSRFADHKFERFYQAQLLWDEMMATQLAAHCKSPEASARVVVIAGEGHTRRFAVPWRTSRREVGPSLLILAIEPDEFADAVATQAADVVAVFETHPPPVAPPHGP